MATQVIQLTPDQHARLQHDFEVYMKAQVRTHDGLSLQHFVDFATSLCNYYRTNAFLKTTEKEPAARYLCALFNRGLKQPIDAEDVHTITALIIEDQTVDYTILKPIL